jgi:uncharacterized glyoxalase superfamily protein PhnB
MGDDQPRRIPMAFHPYLFFSGNCSEAFTRYQEIFGGELFTMKMSDAPGRRPPTPTRISSSTRR